MARAHTHPIAHGDLVISELAGEGLVYNFADHQAHCVTELALRVLRLCDGHTSVTRLAAKLSAAGHQTSAAEAWRTIGQLGGAGLVVIPAPTRIDAGRRRAIQQLGITLAVPMVWSIVAPTVAEAASVTCVMMCMQNGSTDGLPCGMTGATAGVCLAMNCLPSFGNVCR